MPIQIQVPGVGIAEFPDDVSYDDAFKAIQEDVPDFQPSRADVFAKLKRQSESFAAPDANQFLKQEGDSGLQVAYERMAGNVARGVGDILSAPVRLLEKPLDSYYAGERRAARRTGADMPRTFEQSVRSSFDEGADAAETATQGRGNAALNFGADVVGGIAPTLAATALTGGLGGALFAGAQQFGSTRKRVLDYYKSLGLPEDDAQSTADMLGATSGVITGAVTKYTPEVLGKIPGIGKYIGGEGVEGMAKVLLTQRLRQTPVAEIARRAVGNAAGEATEESINQFLLEVVESKQLEPNLSWGEIAKRTAMAGAQGAAGGAGTSIAGDTARAGVERLSGNTPPNDFNYLAGRMSVENAQRELDKRRESQKRLELDALREQSANELAEMAGFEKPHSGQELQARAAAIQQPPVIQAPVAPPPIQSEVQLLKQAEDARQAGQISDQEYLIAVDRFQQARAVNAAQPPALPAPQTPNPLGGELTNEGQIQEEGLQVAPAVTPPPSQAVGEVVQPAPVAALESNPPDKIDAALSRAIEATNPFGKANTGNLGVTYTVLKLTRAAYRAGKSLANAIKESIAQYRAANPTASFNDNEVDAGVRIKLQDFLAGGEDALAIAKASEPAVAENERAAAMIYAEEYTRQRISDRRKELGRLHDQAIQQALGNGIDASLVPSVTSSEFPEFAASLGMDAGLIQELQGDVSREAKARRLSELQTQSEEIGRTITTLTGLDPTKYTPLIAQLTEGKQKLDKRIARKGFDDARVRAAEILDHTREYVSRKARLEALNNPDVKEAISGPVQALRDLMAEFPDIRDRGVSDWVSDPNISDEVKRVVVARLSTAFREFDKHRENVATTLAASEASLERQINRLKERISKGEIRKAYIDIVIEEARLAAAGEAGLTGGLGVSHLEWFDANTEALRSFARSLAEKLNGTGQDALDARKLSDWLLFSPEDAPPAVKNTAQTNWGVGDETLNEIIKALQASPAIRNAVAAIYEKGNERLPAHELRRIASIALSGEEGDAEFAQYLAKQLQKKQGSELLKVIQRLRTDAKNLLDARVRLETLRESLKLFQSVESSPVFKDARIETESQEGSFTRQMFVGDEVGMTLRGFESPTISQPEIHIGAMSGGDVAFDKNTKSALETWRRSAGEYIAEYDAALLASSTIPTAPHPISLGYDAAIYRGLKTALQETNIHLDPSAYEDDSKIDSWKGFNALGQSAKFFQALDATARLVEGVFGKNWQAKNARYRDAKLDVAKVFHNRENAKIPALLSKSMTSHKMAGIDWMKNIPKLGPWFNETFAPGGNVEVYRKLVFDQMAHAARGNFVSAPKVGDILPSGEIVTQADLDLLDQAIKYSNGLLNVAQKNRGTLLDIDKKQYRRPAASVGIKGLARRVGEYGGGNVIELASLQDPAGFGFSTSDDLQNGTRPWIKFWNDLVIKSDTLTRHVLDSVRGDRAITISPYMRTAYEGLAASMVASGYANKISSLEDLVAKLSVHFPAGTGRNAREYITSELGKELSQYVAHAKARVDARARLEQSVSPSATTQGSGTKSKDTLQKSSSMIDTETMNNEFTKPAADLEFPSDWYEYGSISPLEMILAKERAVGEATVELKHAIRESRGFLQSFIAKNQGNKALEDDVKRFGKILEMVKSIDDNVGVDYAKDTHPAFVALKRAGGLAVGGILTTVLGAAGNVLSSAYPAYIYSSRVNNISRAASAALAILHMGRATKNMAYVMIDKAAGGYASSAFKALAKSKNPKMVKVADTLTSWLDFIMKNAGFDAAANVKSLGLSQTDRILTEIMTDWMQSMQYTDRMDEISSRGVIGKSLKVAKSGLIAVESTVKNFNKQIGLEMGDLAVNMAAYQMAIAEERDLKKMAIKWASDRIQKLGAFNESNADWQARPDEWQGGYFQTRHAEAEKLASLRMQMSESGLQLESALWDYWKRSDGGKKKDVEFFSDPASFRRTVIGAINANILTNRPQKAQTNPDQGMFQTLMNYSSNLMVQVMSAFKSVKSAKGMRKWFDIIMRAFWGAIAALLVGLATSAGREVVGRNLTSRIDRRMTSYDKEFWTPDANLPKRLAMVALAIQPFGQSIANITAMNRPDFASGNFYIGFINMLAAYTQGATRVQVQDVPWLVDKFLHGIFKFLDVTDNVGVNATKQLNAGLASAASAVHAAGLEAPSVRSGSGGFQFTEKTPILAKINEAGMRAQIAREKGDEAGLQAALADLNSERDRLIQFHKKSLVDDNKRRGVTMADFKVDQESIAAARKDWLSLNPLTKALGHQPTESEMTRISAYLSGDRKAAFDRAWNAYSGMAESFPNGKGVANEPEMVKQERIAGLGRSGGGLLGGSSASSLSASLRGGGFSGGVRRSGLRTRRGRVSRLSRGVRSRRRSRGRTRGVRRIRF